MGNRSWVVTPEDLKKGDLVQEIGWKAVEIKDVQESEASKDAKTPGSTNITFFFEILDGKDKGVVVKRLFNETAWGFAKNFFAAMNYPMDEAKNYQISMELFRASIGAKLKVYVKRGKSNQGNEFNDVSDFLPLK